MTQKISRSEVAELHSSVLDKVKELFIAMEMEEDYDELDHIKYLLDIDYKLCCMYVEMKDEVDS
jgi:hypothetical protein